MKEISFENIEEIHMNKDVLDLLHIIEETKTTLYSKRFGIKLLITELVPKGFIFMIYNKGNTQKIDLRKEPIPS